MRIPLACDGLQIDPSGVLDTSEQLDVVPTVSQTVFLASVHSSNEMPLRTLTSSTSGTFAPQRDDKTLRVRMELVGVIQDCRLDARQPTMNKTTTCTVPRKEPTVVQSQLLDHMLALGLTNEMGNTFIAAGNKATKYASDEPENRHGSAMNPTKEIENIAAPMPPPALRVAMATLMPSTVQSVGTIDDTPIGFKPVLQLHKLVGQVLQFVFALGIK